MSKEE